MAKKLYEETDVQDIATAIRSKNGTSTTYKVSEMAAAINEISGDGTGSAELAAHIANKNNPHNVTAEQVGADASGSAAAVQSNLNTHSTDATKHITAAERAKWNNKQDALTFDSTPTTGSNNPITSGGVKEALKNLGTGTGGTDISLGLTSATVGQIAKIKTVDSDGKPTEWESVAIGSGSGSSGDAEAVQTNLNAHIADSSKHVTATEKSTWNAKQDAIPYTCVPEIAVYVEDPNYSEDDEITMDNSAFDVIPVPGQLWYDGNTAIWRFCSGVKDRTAESISMWKKLMVAEDVKTAIKTAIPYRPIPSANLDAVDIEMREDDVITMDNSDFDVKPSLGQLWLDQSTNIWRFCVSVSSSDGTSAWKKLMVSEDVASAISSVKVNTTLSAASWSDKKYTISNVNITATSAVELLPRENNGITQAQMEALIGAMIVGGTQATGSIQLVALGDAPTIDIPITLIIRRDL